MQLLLLASPPVLALSLPALGWGWHGQPAVIIGIALLLGGYLWGARKLWRRAGGRRTLPLWRVASFLGSMMALAIALLSPLDRLSADLLSAHMIQHLILLIVAPVCLVLGRPLLVIRWGLPLAMRRRWVQRWRPNSTFNQSRQLVASPLLAFALYSAILWFWHLPAFYQAALQSEWVHVVEHSSFFAAATLLWWVVIFPHGGRDRYGISIAVIFLTAVQGSILGALLTFSTVLWYPMNSLAAASWGITPLDDQQLAGLIMWIPPGVLYLGAIVILFVNWLAAVEQGLRRRERAQIQRTRPLRLVSAHSQTDGG